MTYTEFKRMHIDLGALGAEGGRNAVRYTCTPKGAKIFGWAGVDGIHFCTVKLWGDHLFGKPHEPGAGLCAAIGTGYGGLSAAAAGLRRYRRAGAGVDVD